MGRHGCCVYENTVYYTYCKVQNYEFWQSCSRMLSMCVLRRSIDVIICFLNTRFMWRKNEPRRSSYLVYDVDIIVYRIIVVVIVNAIIHIYNTHACRTYTYTRTHIYVCMGTNLVKFLLLTYSVPRLFMGAQTTWWPTIYRFFSTFFLLLFMPHEFTVITLSALFIHTRTYG